MGDVALDEGRLIELHRWGFDIAEHAATDLDGHAANCAFDMGMIANDQTVHMDVALEGTIDEQLAISMDDAFEDQALTEHGGHARCRRRCPRRRRGRGCGHGTIEGHAGFRALG